MNLKAGLLYLLASAATPLSGLAQTHPNQQVPQGQWGFSLGANQYKEPLMQLVGPEVGVYLRDLRWRTLRDVQFEGDLLFARERYSSEESGSLNGITNMQTYWRALVPIFAEAPSKEGLFTGLAMHTLYNDMRGTTSRNAGGYQRTAGQFWLPVRWAGSMWEVEGGLLLFGRHTSRLSQVNLRYQDVGNKQNVGEYVKVSVRIPYDKDSSLKPFVRYTHLGNSDSVLMDNRYWMEPESHQWQIGITLEFSAR